MNTLNCLIYRRQPDGTYKWEGELAAAAAGYLLQAEDSNAFGNFSLEAAKALLIRGPLKKDWYKILPIPEKELTGAAAKAKARHQEKVASGEVLPKTPKPPREKKEPKGYVLKPLTAEEEARITVIQAEKGVDAGEARKILRTEQRTARLAAARATNPSPVVGKSTLDGEKILELHEQGLSVKQIADTLKASYMGVRLRLIKAGKIQVPSKGE